MAGAAIVALSPQLHFPCSSYASPLHKPFLSIHLPSSYNKITHGIDQRLLVCHAKPIGESGDLNEASFGVSEEMEEYDSDGDDEEEDNTESSIDLLLRLLHTMFKKVSKQARKASRGILPDVFSPQLVSFAVDGVLLLASLSVLKALLEVVCTLGGTVFGVILLLRLIWSAVSYFQSSGTGSHHTRSSQNRAQPAT